MILKVNQLKRNVKSFNFGGKLGPKFDNQFKFNLRLTVIVVIYIFGGETTE